VGAAGRERRPSSVHESESGSGTDDGPDGETRAVAPAHLSAVPRSVRGDGAPAAPSSPPSLSVVPPVARHDERPALPASPGDDAAETAHPSAVVDGGPAGRPSGAGRRGTGRGGGTEDGRIGVLDEVRIKSIRVGVVATVVLLLVIVLYAVLPGRTAFSRGPFFVLIGLAVAGTVPMAFAPWERLVRRRFLMPALYLWSLFDIALVAVAIDLSGGFHSMLYLVFIVECVFMANVSFPRRARVVLTVLTVGAYLGALAVAGWHVQVATLVLRVGIIVTTAGAADSIAVQLTRELVFRERATADHEQRAAVWSRVAGLGQALETLDEEAILGWAVDSVVQLGLEAANVCVLIDDGSHFRVVHPVGLPDAYARTVHSAEMGMMGLVRQARRTVVVHDYDQRHNAHHELRVEGFRTVIATPVRVEGELAAVLVGGTHQRRQVEDYEIAAFELLAAHAGRGLDGARKLEHQRRDAAHFRSLLESAPDAMIVMDETGVVLEANHQVGRLFGYEPDELDGTPVQRLVPFLSEATLRGYRHEFVARHTVVVDDNDDVEGVRKDGTRFPMELVLGSLDTPDGTVITATARNVTERREFERRLEHQATHDHLTGLPNRARFVEHLAAALAAAQVTGPPVAVCFLDVDHFKYVNDSRGHTTGDELVVEVARRIASTARAGDLVARFGGDEFAVLIENLVDRKGAVAYAWRLLAAFDRPFVLDGVECFVSASVGVACALGGDDPDDVLRQADAAMYHAKQSGRARVEVFDETLTARAAERLEIESSLHQALLGDQLSVVYQPVVTIEDGAMVGVEALVRWNHPERGAIPPLSFIPIAEESGLILQIGRWVLARACAQAAAWVEAIGDSSRFTVSVNVSNRQLEHDRMIAEVAAALDESGLPPHCLVLEITESFFMRDVQAAVRRLQALRRLGVRVAIDDFGTGFSSLASLSHLPVDVVKIDKSFIDALGTRYDAVIGAVVEVAKAFDLSVVAEGIERAEQRDRLLDIGCTLAQGYYFGKPVPAAELEARFGAGARLAAGVAPGPSASPAA